MSIKLFCPKEKVEKEKRVAVVPTTVKKLTSLGFEVYVENEAGEGGYFSNQEYENNGAKIINSVEEGYSIAEVIVKVQPPIAKVNGTIEYDLIKQGSIVVGLLEPYTQRSMIEEFCKREITSFALELLPRITRAQSMDVLSSQANVAGYKAAVLGATLAARYFPLLMTAAGTIPPSKVVIMGAGVAGLQALATAKRLGAIVEVSDIRPVVKEQVESLGGKFIDLPLESGEGEGGYAKAVGEDFLRKQREIITDHLKDAEVVITTAMVPGKRAPLLLTKEMVSQMKPGAVIIDLSIKAGGNCELSKADEEITFNGVRIIAPSNLPSTVPKDSSIVYARNIATFLELLVENNSISINLEDEIIKETLLTYKGEIFSKKIGSIKGD